MPAARWPLQSDAPAIEITLSASRNGDPVRRLLADTGAGSRQSAFELIVHENDCHQTGAILIAHVRLAGAFSGVFPVYLVDVSIPRLNFNEPIPAVGVSQLPQGLDGIAGFKFLNRFHYGNFGDPNSFGLDVLSIQKQAAQPS